MNSGDDRTFRTREFAQMAGVTPRALRHYDRLGLLKPKRTGAGYRAYSDRDIERLEQIVALKFIGIPLRKIALLITRAPRELAAALRAQRQMLEEKKRLLDQAIDVIGQAEAALRGGQQPGAAVYRRIIEVIEMQSNSDEWNGKYEALVQAKIARLKALSPEALADLRRQWGVLVEDIRQALGEAPAGPRAQELATRWVRLLEELMGTQVDRATMGFAGSADSAARRGPGEADKPVWDFIQKALASRPQ
jgi:DNA-binding transcriptional MerR regulator